jgi:putative hydrolase
MKFARTTYDFEDIEPQAADNAGAPHAPPRISRSPSDTPLLTLQNIPGVGQEFAERICRHLDIETLEEVEIAAHDGSLEVVPGVGRERAAAIRVALAALLGRSGEPVPAIEDEPSVDILLAADKQYRKKRDHDALPQTLARSQRNAPPRWFALQETRRAGWHLTIVPADVIRAPHIADSTHSTTHPEISLEEGNQHEPDPVAIFFQNRTRLGGLHFVLTANAGALTGHRVVKDRDPECCAYYRIKRRS